ncbi:MAG: VIT1/CCC1 transporter family protein [Chloroflexi bacterium]|nr:VIT1/CCC1 transporter family protein [Chloroflexota bacterium]MCL5273177.1 VIT1/CCC1 transporter family protein [Chloroflexota bacterium]
MSENREQFIKGLQKAWLAEQSSARIYRDLARREKSEARRRVLLKLAESEVQHSERWAARLRELGAALPEDRVTLASRAWNWVLVQSGTDNALKRIESTEDEGAELYESLATIAPTEDDRSAIHAVQHEEQVHSGFAHLATDTARSAASPQVRLDTILHRESWHKRGGGWIGQAIYGANDGLGSVFGIVSGVAGATAGGHAVLIAGLAGMLASALSMGSGAYLATKAEREVQEAEINRERREMEIHPDEEREELSLFYQLKGVPEDEALILAARLVAQPESALKTLVSEELGLSEENYPNPWTAALTASLSTAFGAFIPIIPFFILNGYPAIIASFIISTLAHFLIGAAKTVVTGLSAWRSGAEMTIVGLGEALITYALGLLFGPVVG